ncbi:MAG: hypothetical protein RR645_04115 [Clostridium sp.]
MNIFKRFLLSLMFVMVLATCLGSSVEAFVDIPRKVKQEALKGIYTMHISTFEADRHNFGISESDSIGDLSLGKGLPVYSIDYSKLNSSNEGMVDVIRDYGNPNYRFAVKVGGKPIGIGEVMKKNGVYEVFRVGGGPGSDFEKQISETLDASRKSGDFNSDDICLIEDNHVFRGIYSKGDEKVVLVNDSETLGLKKGQVVGFKDIHKRLLYVYEEGKKMAKKGMVFGGPGPYVEPYLRSGFIVIVSIGIMITISAILIIRGRRK